MGVKGGGVGVRVGWTFTIIITITITIIEKPVDPTAPPLAPTAGDATLPPPLLPLEIMIMIVDNTKRPLLTSPLHPNDTTITTTIVAILTCGTKVSMMLALRS